MRLVAFRSILGLAATAAIVAPSTLAAQGSFGALSYNVSLPTGDTKDFIDNPSWIGLAVDGRRFFVPHASVGIALGWNKFSENTDRAISIPGIIPGSQYRSLNMFPGLVTFDGYFGRERGFRAYVGFGVGAYYIRQKLEVGDVSFSENNFIFGFAPEFGITLPMAEDKLFLINVRYHYPVNAGQFIGGVARNMTYVAIGVGFAYQH